MALAIEIGAGVIVNGRTMTVLVVIVMRGIRGMNVKGETLRLERKKRESREGNQATPHKPSLWNHGAHVNGATAQRPLTIGKTKTRENDHRLASLGKPVAT